MATLVISGPFTVWHESARHEERLIAERYPAEYPVDLVNNPETGVPDSYYRIVGTELGVAVGYLEWHTNVVYMKE